MQLINQAVLQNVFSLAGPDRADQRKRSPFIHQVISDHRFLCQQQNTVTALLSYCTAPFDVPERIWTLFWHLSTVTLFKKLSVLLFAGARAVPAGPQLTGSFLRGLRGETRNNDPVTLMEVTGRLSDVIKI